MLLLHGISEHSGRYEHVGRHLAAAGVEVIAIDHRGFGMSGGRRAYVASFDEFVDDVEDQLAEVRMLGLPTVLLGHSMGGLIALSYVLEGRPAPDALALSGPALGANVPALLRVLVPVLNRLAPRLRVPTPIKGSQLATDPLVGQAYFADPLVVRTSTPALGHAMLARVTWANEHLARLDAHAVPTLVQHGADDPLVPASSTVALGGLPGVHRIEYPGLRHEIFNEPAGPAVLDDLLAWLHRVL
jgi:alpha-beta hydrolase superfamily lysophospholipase